MFHSLKKLITKHLLGREESFARSEKGSTIVLVALGLTAFIGFTGLAVDYGTFINQRGLLQNAADSAALAGAATPGAASSYVARNISGVSSQSISEGGPVCTVTLTKQCPTYFMRALGFTGTDVTVSATAQRWDFTYPEGYAIWAQDSIKFNKATVPDKMKINTSNTGFSANHQNLATPVAGGTPEAGGTPGAGGTPTPTPTPAPGTPDLKGFNVEFGPGETLPDYSDIQHYAIPVTDQDLRNFEDTNLIKGAPADPNAFYYYDGSYTFQSHSVISLNLICKGSIKGHGQGCEATSKFVASLEGDVELKGMGGAASTFIYCPNGTMKYSGTNSLSKIMIICKDFVATGNNSQIGYDPTVFDDMPKYAVRLIK